MAFAMIRAVLLDVDGTLVDSNDAHAQAWVDAFAEFGQSVPFERVRPLIGKGGDKLMPEAIGVPAESPVGKRIDERRTEIFKNRYLPKLEAFPRAEELLARFRSDGFRLVVATSAKKEEMDALLEICGASKLIDERTSSDDAEQSKPDADIVAAALSRAGAASHDALLLGDTPYDVEAARRTGVGTVALRSGGWDAAALTDAVAVYADASELLDRYADSPFARPYEGAAHRKP
jgi:phosphoglycolate phosphatase-like HAD superfamily hydrolase